MANIIVLGAGLVGGVIAKDLALTHNITCVDISRITHSLMCAMEINIWRT